MRVIIKVSNFKNQESLESDIFQLNLVERKDNFEFIRRSLVIKN